MTDEQDNILRLIAENIRLREELSVVRQDRKALGQRVVALEFALSRHRDKVQGMGFSSSDDRQLWDALDDPWSVLAVTNDER